MSELFENVRLNCGDLDQIVLRQSLKLGRLTILHPGLLLGLLVRRPFDSRYRSVRANHPQSSFLRIVSGTHETDFPVSDRALGTLFDMEVLIPIDGTDFCGRKVWVLNEDGYQLFYTWQRSLCSVEAIAA